MPGFGSVENSAVNRMKSCDHGWRAAGKPLVPPNELSLWTEVLRVGQTAARSMSTKVPTEHESWLARIHRALGPIAGGLILDLVDLATFGPIGLFGGFLMGGIVGWWVSSIYEFSARSRVMFAVLAAVYTAVPLTEPFPLATGISALARFRERHRRDSE